METGKMLQIIYSCLMNGSMCVILTYRTHLKMENVHWYKPWVTEVNFIRHINVYRKQSCIWLQTSTAFPKRCYSDKHNFIRALSILTSAIQCTVHNYHNVKPRKPVLENLFSVHRSMGRKTIIPTLSSLFIDCGCFL